MVIAISTMVFISFILMLTSIYLVLIKKAKAIDRLNVYDENYIDLDKDKKQIKKRKSWIKSLGNLLKILSPSKRILSKYKVLLIRADIPISEEEYFGVKMVFACALAFLAYSMTNDFFIVLVCLIAVWQIPNIILKIRIDKRMKEFNLQLGEAIVIVSNSLKAGYSFMQAISSVAKESPDPLSKEFKTLFKEMSFGIDTDEALRNLVSRVDSQNLELMVTSIIIQREVGGNLSEILDNISETISERQKLKNELKTLTAQGKLSGAIIIFLPMLLGLTLYFLNKDYIMLLFTTTPGIIMSVLGVLNQMIGIFIISKIIKVEL